MKKEQIKLPEIKLVGLTVRTNNQNEMSPETSKILPILQNYFGNNFPNQISNRSKPGTTYCCYTEYESDHTGEYTYFVGEEVTNFVDVPSDFETHTIPAQTYTKFTNGPGPMPEVVREPWMAIWEMTEQELGGKRTYHTDFEIYDERASDHSAVVLDIYIGIQS